MRFRYLPDAGVALLDSFDPDETVRLQDVLLALASSDTSDVQLDDLLGWERVDHASLVARVGSQDAGVRAVAGAALGCALTPETWRSVAGLLEPFSRPQTGEAFQYLSEEGAIRWIISTSGEW